MGLNSRLVRSILAIRDESSGVLKDGDRMMPAAIVVVLAAMGVSRSTREGAHFFSRDDGSDV